MPLIDRLERNFGRFTFPHLLPVLIVGQVLVFGASSAGLVHLDQLVMNADAVMAGEVWRMFTFLVVPLDLNPLWFAIGAYITYLIGGSLERQWGEFRFGLYVGLGWLATVLGAWLIPGAPVMNTYIMGSLTLAFARLFPHVEFLVFFLIPVKVRYIGYVMWAFYALTLVAGPVEGKVQVAAGVVPFFAFFGKEVLSLMKQRQRRRSFREKARVDVTAAFHTCASCGATDKTHPGRAFRYKGGACYCDACLNGDSSP